MNKKSRNWKRKEQNSRRGGRDEQNVEKVEEEMNKKVE